MARCIPLHGMALVIMRSLTRMLSLSHHVPRLAPHPIQLAVVMDNFDTLLSGLTLCLVYVLVPSLIVHFLMLRECVYKHVMPKGKKTGFAPSGLQTCFDLLGFGILLSRRHKDVVGKEGSE